MNEKMTKLILGSLVISLFKETISQNEYNCKVYEENNIILASCKGNERIEGVPQDIDANIKKLDLSDNILRNISEDQFKRYENLKILTMVGVNSTFNLSLYYLFRPLKKLEVLNLDFCSWNWVPFDKIFNLIPADTVFYWPPNLKNLTLRYAWIWFLDLSNLKKLEYLDARENVLRIFPTFNKFAPLKHLNLNFSRMTRMRAEDLAPLCYLEELHVAFFDSYEKWSPELVEPEKYCECERIKAWAKEFGIKGSLPKCKPRSGETCDLSFSEDMLSARKTCLLRKSGGSQFPIFLILFLILIIIAASAGGYFYWVIKIKSENSDSS